jgi:hypothetical protein
MGKSFAGAQLAIENGQTLNEEAGRQYVAFVNELDRQVGYHVSLTEGTRTWERQNYLFVNQSKPGFNPAWSPDRPSVHQLGNAADLGGFVGTRGSKAQVVAHRIAGDYGFWFPLDYELWHAEYRGGARLIAPAGIRFTFGLPAKPDAAEIPAEVLIEVKEQRMFILWYTDKNPTTVNGKAVKNGDQFLYVPGRGFVHIWDAGALAQLGTLDVKTIQANRLQFENVYRAVVTEQAL